LDSETSVWEQLPVEKNKTSTVMGNRKPYHQYQIYLQNVAEKGTQSCHEKPILITTGDVSIFCLVGCFLFFPLDGLH